MLKREQQESVETLKNYIADLLEEDEDHFDILKNGDWCQNGLFSYQDPTKWSPVCRLGMSMMRRWWVGESRYTMLRLERITTSMFPCMQPEACLDRW